MLTLLTAVSGLNAASTRTRVSAHNIANAATPDFISQEAVQTSRDPGVSVEVKEGQAGVDLGKEIVNLISQEISYKANLKVVATTDELQGLLVDIKS